MLAVVAIALTVFVGGAGARVRVAAGACAGTGTASSSPGFKTSGSSTQPLNVDGSVKCQGTTSGAIHASGSLTGNCSKLAGSATISGALNGTITIATNGPSFTLKGVLNGHPFTAAGTFAPKTGNCVTTPLTSATIAFAGGFTK